MTPNPSVQPTSGQAALPARPATAVLDQISKVISGGQSGVDRAALDLALELNIPTGGWCPKGAMSEDGPISPRYGLVESASADPALRTELNVRDSDGTLILLENQMVRGTLLTGFKAAQYGRPWMIVFVDLPPDPAAFKSWLTAHNVRRLNIAGPRESDEPGLVYDKAINVLRALFVSPGDRSPDKDSAPQNSAE